jgi:hypothetical protein
MSFGKMSGLEMNKECIISVIPPFVESKVSSSFGFPSGVHVISSLLEILKTLLM